jgi:PPOX class probable F420-dependent enzyme
MRERVATARVARLATVRPDGAPHVVPVCFALVGDTIVSVVDSKPKRTPALQRLANVRARPDASLLVDHYDDDWTTLWWVRVDGSARVLDDGDAHRRAVSALVSKYPQYRDARPDGPVLVLEPTRWSGWRYAG